MYKKKLSHPTKGPGGHVPVWTRSKGKSLRAEMGEQVIRESSLISRQPHDRQNTTRRGTAAQIFFGSLLRAQGKNTANLAVSLDCLQEILWKFPIKATIKNSMDGSTVSALSPTLGFITSLDVEEYQFWIQKMSLDIAEYPLRVR